MSEDIKDGLHFNLPDEVYHSIPAMSASGIKNLLVHPCYFWANSWMNPLKDEEEQDTMARILGKAYHKRILEPQAFSECYAPSFEYEGDDALRTVDDMKAWLDMRGFAKSYKTKADFMTAILSYDPSAPVYDALKEQYERQHLGKVLLPKKYMDRIEMSAAMIEKNPHLSKCFTGGASEVTIIWTDDGVRYKARFDYLKPYAFTDLKTFETFKVKALEGMVYDAMASYKYHIQGAFYGAFAFPAVRAAVANDAVFYHEAPDWLTHKCKVLVQAFKMIPLDIEPDCQFVFQLKKPYPIAAGYTLTRSTVWQNGLMDIELAKKRYKQCVEKYGTDPWVDAQPMAVFEDLKFPLYVNDLYSSEKGQNDE